MSGEFDYELSEPEQKLPASGGKVALFALAMFIGFMAIFYEISKNNDNNPGKPTVSSSSSKTN